MVLEIPAIPAIPEFIAVPECDDSCSDDDTGGVPRRARYFSGILAVQARSRAKEEVMLYGDGDEDEEYEQEVIPETQSLRDYLFQIMPAEWRKEIETPLIPDKKDEDVEIYSPWPKGYETPESRLKLLQREVKMLCHGNGYLNVDNLKPDSQDFVDGILDCAFEVAMGRCAMAEAKAAKRRAKRHRKREMENLRRCLDRKRKLEEYDDKVHFRAAPVEGGDKNVIDVDIDAEIEGQAKKEEKCIDIIDIDGKKEEEVIDVDGLVEKEEPIDIDGHIKDEIVVSDGRNGAPNALFSLSRVPCSADEMSAEQRRLLMEFDDEEDDSSDEECMDTCPEDDSMRSSSV